MLKEAKQSFQTLALWNQRSSIPTVFPQYSQLAVIALLHCFGTAFARTVAFKCHSLNILVFSEIPWRELQDSSLFPHHWWPSGSTGYSSLNMGVFWLCMLSELSCSAYKQKLREIHVSRCSSSITECPENTEKWALSALPQNFKVDNKTQQGKCGRKVPCPTTPFCHLCHTKATSDQTC